MNAVETGICGFTQYRIIKINGSWVTAECGIRISQEVKEILIKQQEHLWSKRLVHDVSVVLLNA